MAYEKQTWKTGDVITEEKLNHMEDGIANAGSGSSGNLFVDATALNEGVLTSVDMMDFYETDAELADITEAIGIRVGNPRIGTEIDFFLRNRGVMTLYPASSGDPYYLANECQAVVCTTDNGPVAIVRTGTATINEGGDH